jgi:hypothetical protein
VSRRSNADDRLELFSVLRLFRARLMFFSHRSVF